MNAKPSALIVVENSSVPWDIRVWYEALTLRDAGWNITVICPTLPKTARVKIAPAISGGQADLEGINILYFALRSANRGFVGYLVEYITAFLKIAGLSWRVWRHGHFDVLQLCNPPDIFFPLEWFYRLLGAAIIFDHHDLFPEFVGHRFPGTVGKLAGWLARIFEYLTCQGADIMIAVNESYRDIAIERSGLAPSRIVIVRNGPRIDWFSPVGPVEALKKGFPFLVCYAGVMGYEDGVPEIVECIRHVVKDLGRQDILFCLLGAGALREWAIQRIEEWGLTPYAELPGMIRDPLLLKQYLSTADLCVSPEPLTPLNAKSTFIKVGEYMAMGKPVVAFDLRETRRTAGDAAVYVEPGDVQGFARAISDLLLSTERRTEMGRFARQRFLDYLGWEHQAPHLLAAYAQARQRRAGHTR